MRRSYFGNRLTRIAAFAAVSTLLCFLSAPAASMSLREAIDAALHTNPDIGEVIARREATEAELRRARSQYLPRVDFEASTGRRMLDNPARRAGDIEHNSLRPGEISVTATLNLFDGFAREAEIERNLARRDGASHQIVDRSESIALSIAREYIQIMLQVRIQALTEENLRFHRTVMDRIERGVRGGGLSAADRQQAAERLKSVEARLVQVREDLDRARIAFFKLVGQRPSQLAAYPRLGPGVPSMDGIEEISAANPRVKSAEAELDAAVASLKGARANYLPRVGLEGSTRHGEDIDGVDDRTRDNQVKVVTRWNLFAGGADLANEQAQAHRVVEARMRVQSIKLEVREAMAAAWNSRRRQQELAETLRSQAALGKDVVQLYDEQFRAGRRTLLDLLSAQNNYYNAQTLAETARHARDLADYRILAAAGRLLAALNVTAPASLTKGQTGWEAIVHRH